MTIPSWVLMTACGSLLLACADDLRDGADDIAVGPAMPITNMADGDGVTRTVVNATDAEAWIYFDFESKGTLNPAAPEDSGDWDLAFQRFRIKLNGGASGSGNVELARLEGADFAAVELPPADGFITDKPDGEDDNTEPDLAFSSGDQAWYAYDSTDHTLTARDYVYAVRSVAGDFYKLKLLEYYDAAGTGGFPAFRWAPLAPQD